MSRFVVETESTPANSPVPIRGKLMQTNWTIFDCARARFMTFVGLYLLTAVSAQAGQWTVTYLNPEESSSSAAWGGGGSQEVGNAGGIGTGHALLWNGSA